MTTQEGNKLIAEFMGYSSPTEKELDDKLGGSTHPERWMRKGDEFKDIRYMKYHSSWDWLMPCVKKIKILEDKTHFDARGVELIQAINKYICMVQIEDAHLYVVEFIQWHNQQK